jgi:hypothetical protein
MGNTKLGNVGVVGLALLGVMCGGGADRNPPEGGTGAGAGGALPEAGANAGAVASGGDDSEVAGQGSGGSPLPAGGEGGGAGAHAGAAGGGAAADCDADDVALRAVLDVQPDVLSELSYQGGRLRYVRAGELDAYQYHYGSTGRLEWVLHGFDEGKGFYLQYPSPDVVTYTDDDYPQYYRISYEAYRWTWWASIPEIGSTRYERTPVWEQGLLTQITHLQRTFAAGEDPVDSTSIETFSYDVDGEGNPIRMVSSAAAPLWRTREVYDAQGRHLFQLVETAAGEPSQIRLFRDNQDPVHSLFEPASPGDELSSGPDAFASNEWLRLAFDPAQVSGALQGLAPHGAVRPLDLAPWHPLALASDEVGDFAADLDGDSDVDVTGDFTFDDGGRLTAFVLEIDGAERFVLRVTHTPSLVTETASYPHTERADDVRHYFYGCNDTALPEGWSRAGAPAD